jgi:hypothetical protein
MSCKLDHIPELTGQANYHAWSQDMTLTLWGACLWNHVSNGVNLMNPINFVKSCPVVTVNSNAAAFEELEKWQATDTEVIKILLIYIPVHTIHTSATCLSYMDSLT